MGGGEIMSAITVYHGGTECIVLPRFGVGRKRLDFGQGFYVTDIRQQAIQWATTTALRRNATPVLNVYQLEREAILSEARCKIFRAYDKEWLDYIVANREGIVPNESFDYIEGGVADDRVIDTVNLYMSGLMSADIALQRLALHKPNNQICLLNQTIIDKYLRHERCECL